MYLSGQIKLIGWIAFCALGLYALPMNIMMGGAKAAGTELKLGNTVHGVFVGRGLPDGELTRLMANCTAHGLIRDNGTEMAEALHQALYLELVGKSQKSKRLRRLGRYMQRQGLDPNRVKAVALTLGETVGVCEAEESESPAAFVSRWQRPKT